MRFCAMAVPSTAITFVSICKQHRQYFLQKTRNRKRVTQKEKEIIAACALSQNASYFETVAVSYSVLLLGKKS